MVMQTATINVNNCIIFLFFVYVIITVIDVVVINILDYVTEPII